MGKAKRLGFVAVVLAVALALGATGAGGANGTSGVPAGEGVGMYTDSSTANQASTFTINRKLVTCGVGGVDVAGPGTGPFEMLMFSTRIDSYSVNPATKEIDARGEMRSITRLGGNVLEDVRHPFIALAVDLDGDESQPRTDRFDVHFKTPFWQPGNPLCTPSTRFPGLCRFGGVLIAGNINVRAGHH